MFLSPNQISSMEFLDIPKKFSEFPVSLNLFLSLIVLAVSLWLAVKKTDVLGKKSENEIQVARVESLMQQIRLLSDELDKTRNQLSFFHKENIELMNQLREANKRISDLETAMKKCGQCIFRV